MKKALYLGFLVILSSCSSLRVYDSKSRKESGFWYALPKNIVVVEIPVKKFTYKRSDCFNQIDKELPHLNLKGVYPKDSMISYSLGKATISMKAVPDLNKVYKVEPSNRFVKNSNYSFVYSDLGVLNSTELQNENKLFDLVIETINAATNIGVNTARGIAPTEESKCAEIQHSLEAVQEIRYHLLGPENKGTKEIFEKQMAIIDATEAKLLNDFVVALNKEEYIFRFNFTPNSGLLSKDLFKFSTKEGVLLISGTNGPYEEESITDDMANKVKEPGATFSTAETVSISISNNVASDQLSAHSMMSVNNGNLKGFVFNIPAYTTVSLLKGKSSISKTSLLIAQLGTTSRLTHKVSKLTVELDPTTGALKKVGGQTTAGGPDAVKRAGETANNTISKLRREKETELEILTRERQILEEKQKIRELKKEVEQ